MEALVRWSPAASTRAMFDDVVCHDEEVECNLIHFKALVIERHGNRGAGAGAGQIRSHNIAHPIAPPPRSCEAFSRSEKFLGVDRGKGP
jgi:hypothetical protein